MRLGHKHKWISARRHHLSLPYTATDTKKASCRRHQLQKISVAATPMTTFSSVTMQILIAATDGFKKTGRSESWRPRPCFLTVTFKLGFEYAMRTNCGLHQSRCWELWACALTCEGKLPIAKMTICYGMTTNTDAYSVCVPILIEA